MVIFKLRDKNCLSTENFNSSLSFGIIFTENLVSKCKHSVHKYFPAEQKCSYYSNCNGAWDLRDRIFFKKLYPCVKSNCLLYTVYKSEYFFWYNVVIQCLITHLFFSNVLYRLQKIFSFLNTNAHKLGYVKCHLPV